MSLRADLNQITLALADALDLVGIDELAHGKRVGYMAFKCAETLQLDKRGRERLFNIGLLHDIGVSSSREHSHLVSELQWENAQLHATEGADIVRDFGPFKDFSDPIRYHHTPWKKLKNLSNVDMAAKLDGNLIFLVDRIDAESASHYGIDLLEHVDRIRDWVKGYSDNLFSPELVELFLNTSTSDAFWMQLESPHLDRFLYDMERHSDQFELEVDEIKQLACIFAYVVDAKSKFTSKHSYGVANLAAHLGQLIGLKQSRIDMIEIAGLLHDIGKLRIPDEVLEKSGPLSGKEKQLMHRHSFETYQILRRIDGFSDLALWASYHHETPDGHGYPFQRHGNDLTQEARIIAVADVFQALAQNRPYRAPMQAQQIVSILFEMANEGKLDNELVDLVNKNLEACYQAAVDMSPAQPIAS